MIGIISNNDDREIVTEFFELFKTPWEFYNHKRAYDIVVTANSYIPQTNSKLLIIYGSDRRYFGNIGKMVVQSSYKNTIVNYERMDIPIYKNLVTFKGVGQPIIYHKENMEIAGLEIECGKNKKIALGYNLFEEMNHLLSTGQPKENAHIPTLEIHILILRTLIIDAGISLIEIPPIPGGFNFTACLTHDIDFCGIRNHKFDRTMWGFLYRASVESVVRFMKKRISFQKLIKNWRAVITLPLVFLGLRNDFWNQLKTYAEIEKEMKATFFLIPFKNTPGEKIQYSYIKKRRTKYDILDLRETLKGLSDEGFEIGIHGIDAWHSLDKARQEIERIVEYYNGAEIGVRIHWLLWGHDTYRILEEAGFSYDSSFGYNEAIGYRAGTGQVFKPFSTENLLELPLHIQDTALFYKSRLNLSENNALHLFDELLKKAERYGGVLTLLWHNRSLAPERLWGDSYIKILNKMKGRNAWFATAGEVVQWFRKRRSLSFEIMKNIEKRVKVSLKKQKKDCVFKNLPPLILRIYHSKKQGSGKYGEIDYKREYRDISWNGKEEMHILLK